jgi:hypothetical protein
MKTETKLKKVTAILIKYGYDANTAADAIAETNRWFKLEKYTPANFVEALVSTCGIEGVQR